MIGAVFPLCFYYPINSSMFSESCGNFPGRNTITKMSVFYTCLCAFFNTAVSSWFWEYAICTMNYFFLFGTYIYFLVPWITVKLKRTKSGSCLDVALYFLYIITNINNILFWWCYILKSFWQSLLSHMYFYISPAACCSFCTSLKKQHIITFLLNFHFF